MMRERKRERHRERQRGRDSNSYFYQMHTLPDHVFNPLPSPSQVKIWSFRSSSIILFFSATEYCGIHSCKILKDNIVRFQFYTHTCTCKLIPCHICDVSFMTYKKQKNIWIQGMRECIKSYDDWIEFSIYSIEKYREIHDVHVTISRNWFKFKSIH